MNPPSQDQIAAYLARIGHSGDATPDLATLGALHRAHVDAISWECFDCFAGVPTSRSPAEAFDKIVRRGRGGWCYEMNGLFAWILEGLGFRVDRLAAGVMRAAMGDDAVGNHLALIVHLDRPWLADVGLGSGLVDPIPLAEGTYRQRHVSYRLERLDDRWWRFHNQPDVLPDSFDFAPDLTDEELLESRCRFLQQSPDSPFRQSAVAQRHTPDGLLSLIGPTLKEIRAGERLEQQVDSAEAYRQVLAERFGVKLDDPAAIWSRLAQA